MPLTAASERLLLGPVASDPTVRADGAAVAFVVTEGDLAGDRWVRHVEVIAADGAHLGATTGPADRHPRFSPVGDDLLFVRALPDGAEAIVRLPDDRPVVAFPRAVRTFEWSPDGRRLAVVLTERPAPGSPVVVTGPAYKRDGEEWRPSSASLVVVDVDTAETEPVLGPLPSMGDIAWTAGGDALLVALPYDPRSWRWDLHRVELGGGPLTPLTHHGAWERAACPLDVHGRIVHVGGEAGPRHAELVLIDHGRARRLAEDLDRNITVGAPAYPGARPFVAGGRLYATANDESVSRLFSLTLAGDDVTPLTPPGVVVHGAAGVDGLRVVATANSQRSSAIEVVDGPVLWSAGDHDPPWGVEQLAVVAPDGMPVPCWLLRSRSAGPGPAPVLVDLHGGPHNVSNPALSSGNLHRWLLAEQGWHVLLPNVRGSDGFGEDWYRGLEAGGGWAGDDLDDVIAVRDAAVAAGIADPARVALHGYSYGGLLTAALTTRTDSFRAAALGGAPIDLRAFVSSADMPSRLWEREVGGLPWSDGRYDERSPIRRAGAVRTPTLVVHGAADQRVPVTQGEQWFQALQANGVPSELVIYPGAPHGFVSAGSPATVADVAQRIADWLLRWNTSSS